jgi:hypothetical protein
MKAENQLLIHLLQTGARKEIESFLQNPIDWEIVLQTAEKHKVVPLVFQNLENYSALVPAEFFEQIQTRCRNLAAKNLGKTLHLLKLGELFKANDVPFIAYKGAALAAFAYQDVALRQFTDLDLLIRKKDFPRVKRLIVENGGEPAWNLTAKEEKAVLKYYYEYPFVFGDSKKTLVEIHWHLLESFFAFDFETEKLFARAENVSLYGKSVPTLNAADTLVIATAHGSKHFWKRLAWICDIGKLIETDEIDWSAAFELARRFGSLRMLRLGLRLANDVLKCALPEEIRRDVDRDGEVKLLADALKNTLFEENNEFAGMKMAKTHLKMRERVSDKIKYSKRLVQTKMIDSLFMPMGRPR